MASPTEDRAAAPAPEPSPDAAAADAAAPPAPTEEELREALERQVEADRAEFGYALGAPAVRRYAVADVHTARKALNDNVGSFFANEREAEIVTRVTDMRLVLSALSILVGIASHAAPIPFPESYNFIIGCIVGYYVLTAISIYAWRVVEGDSFLTIGVRGRPSAAAGKKKDTTQQQQPKKYVQFSSTVERFKAEYKLRAQVVQPAAFPLFPPKRVGAAVERTYFFGTFFSERGLIHPPAVRAEMDKLISDLKLA